jgi:hypothetical protein
LFLPAWHRAGYLPLRSEALQQHTGGFIVQVLRHQFASEGLGENSLIEMVDQLTGVGPFGCEPIDPGEGCVDAAKYFSLFMY